MNDLQNEQQLSFTIKSSKFRRRQQQGVQLKYFFVLSRRPSGRRLIDDIVIVERTPGDDN